MTTNNEMLNTMDMQEPEEIRQDQEMPVDMAEAEAMAAKEDAAYEDAAVEGEGPAEENAGGDAGEAPEEESRAAPRRTRRRRPRVIEGDYDDSDAPQALTPEQQESLSWKAIRRAMEDRSILERQIIGVEKAGEGRATPRVFVQYDGFKIAISTRDFFSVNFFSVDPERMDEEERNRREFQMASRMIGAYIPFVITDAQSAYDEENGKWIYAIRASRKEAIRRRRRNYYLGEEPRVRVGDTVKARVIMSGQSAIAMEVVGQEILVPAAEMSGCHWIDPMYDYPAGTAVYVQVTELEVDRETDTVHLAVSRKPLEADLAKRSYEAVGTGMRYIGTVISVGRDYVRINLDCNVRVAAPVMSLTGQRLHYGDRVSVSIKSKNDEKMTCYGSCLPIARRTV